MEWIYARSFKQYENDQGYSKKLSFVFGHRPIFHLVSSQLEVTCKDKQHMF